MIDQTIVDALVLSPITAEIDPEITITAQEPTQRALLSYAADVVRSQLYADHGSATRPVPSQIILSFVAEYAKGQLILLSRASDEDALERQSLMRFSKAIRLDRICAAIETGLDGKTLHHFEAIVPTHISAHSRLLIEKRLTRLQTTLEQ